MNDLADLLDELANDRELLQNMLRAIKVPIQEDDLCDRARAAAERLRQDPSDYDVQLAVEIYDGAYKQSSGQPHTGFGPSPCTPHHRDALRAVLAHFGGITQQQEKTND